MDKIAFVDIGELDLESNIGLIIKDERMAVAKKDHSCVHNNATYVLRINKALNYMKENL